MKFYPMKSVEIQTSFSWKAFVLGADYTSAGNTRIICLFVGGLMVLVFIRP